MDPDPGNLEPDPRPWGWGVPNHRVERGGPNSIILTEIKRGRIERERERRERERERERETKNDRNRDTEMKIEIQR